MVTCERSLCERWSEDDVTVGRNASVTAMWTIYIAGDRTLLTTIQFISWYRCMKDALDYGGR